MEEHPKELKHLYDNLVYNCNTCCSNHESREHDIRTKERELLEKLNYHPKNKFVIKKKIKQKPGMVIFVQEIARMYEDLKRSIAMVPYRTNALKNAEDIIGMTTDVEALNRVYVWKRMCDIGNCTGARKYFEMENSKK